MFRPLAAKVSDHLVNAAELAVIAAGDETGLRGIWGKRKHGAVMGFDGGPGLAIGERDQTERAVAEGKGCRTARTVEAGGYDECVERAVSATGFEQVLGDGLAHRAPSPTPPPPRAGGGR